MNLISNDNHIINIWRFRSAIPTINLLDINLCHNSQNIVDKTTLRFQNCFIDNVFVFMEIIPFDPYGHKIFHKNCYLLGFFIYVYPPWTTILLVDYHMDIAMWLKWWKKKMTCWNFLSNNIFPTQIK